MMMITRSARQIPVRSSSTNLKTGSKMEGQSMTSSRFDTITLFTEEFTLREISELRKRFFWYHKNRSLLLKWQWNRTLERKWCIMDFETLYFLQNILFWLPTFFKRKKRAKIVIFGHSLTSYQRHLRISPFSSTKRKRKSLKDLLFWSKLKKNVKTSKLTLITYATRYLSMRNSISLDFLKSEWWCLHVSLAWTFKGQRQTALFQWQTCSTINAQNKPHGAILMKKVDLSLRLCMTLKETVKYLILMERNVTLDSSWTTDLLYEITTQMRSLLRFTIILMISFFSSKRRWSRMVQNTRNSEWARIWEITQCRSSSLGSDL